jgi:DNA-binding transcriptional LysR family regulator
MRQLSYIESIAKAGSIRKAAETLAITSTALNRRVLALEEELGEPVFKRPPRSVRLSTAGGLLLHHIRRQLSEYEKLKSQIVDLSGERQGHVRLNEVQVLARVRQQVHAVLAADHPLAHKSVLRLRECAQFPVGV